jgi:two-component system sensor histidine kinase UhpB
MRESRTEVPPSRLTHESPARDAAIVIGLTLLGIIVSVHFNLSEALYTLTRHWEFLQIDELPLAMLVLCTCLIWLSWKRYRHARRELQARRIAEQRLAAVLAENRLLARENLRIQEVERKRLARELHDELGQYLNAIKLDAVAIREGSASDPGFPASTSLSIIRSVDHVHAAVSDIIRRLRPVGLDELGLVAAIEHCIDHWRARMPHTDFGLSMRGNLEDLCEPLNLTLYRLIQEGLTNIYKHAHAQRVTVTLERTQSSQPDQDEMCLTVADDGCGMEPGTRNSRFGLSGMRERVELAGGTFALESAPGQGLCLRVRLPTDGESR